MSQIKILLFLVSMALGLSTNAGVRVKMKVENGRSTLLSATERKGPIVTQKKTIRNIPYYLDSGKDSLNTRYVEYEIPDADITPEISRHLERPRGLPQGTEFREIIVQGPHENRINLTILGDGYTSAEKEKFFADAARTARGLFEGHTFASYLPLFNIYAVYVPSQKSGIGDGSPINTAFKLYRTPKGSKRAIMPGDEGALERALDAAPATDYPIVIANDEYYGGLGGRFAISTSSELSGLIVLRHELGHNFGEVGEEYDGGSAYFGANSSNSSTVSWQQWSQTAQISVNEAKVLTGDYVWQNLSQGPYEAQFKIPNGHELLYFELSSVGWATPQDILFTVNDKALDLMGQFQNDRSFFNTTPTPVTAGASYKVKVEEKIHDGNNVLGFAVAFSTPKNYDFTPNKIGAFATYSESGQKTYRPTHQSCLMRDMLSENFCAVDKENMWIQFLNRVKLIDTVAMSGSTTGAGQKVALLAQDLKGLSIRWYQMVNNQEVELTQLQDQKMWESGSLKGKFRVKVDFKTAEVLKFNSRFKDQRDFTL